MGQNQFFSDASFLFFFLKVFVIDFLQFFFQYKNSYKILSFTVVVAFEYYEDFLIFQQNKKNCFFFFKKGDTKKNCKTVQKNACMCKYKNKILRTEDRWTLEDFFFSLMARMSCISPHLVGGFGGLEANFSLYFFFHKI